MLKISEYRKLCGISQKDFAKMLGVSAGNLCEWEKGRIEPNISSLIKMAEILDVSIDELIGKEPNSSNARPTQKQDELIRLFNLLDEENKENLLGLLKTLTKNK